MKRKTGKEVASTLTKLFKIAVPSRLWTDKGTEFYNQHVKRVLEANSFTLYSRENEEKSSVAERWNRTMKRITWKYFTANNTNKYIDELQNMVDKYNTTSHRSIKLSPSNARNPSNYKREFTALYGKIRPPPSLAKFHVGEKLRIVRKKDTVGQSTGNCRENNPLLPQSLRGLVIGKSGCGKTIVIFNLLL